MELELQNFKFGYLGKYFFSPLDIVFKSNNIYVLTGGNGSGKTTFLDVLSCGFSNDNHRFYSGTVKLKNNYGEDEKLSEKLSYFIQFFNDIFYQKSVKEEILQLLDESFYHDLIHEFRELEFDFNFLENKSPFELNFTEQKKLGIILTLIAKKQIVFLDEFDSRLSFSDQLFFCNYLKKIKKDKIVIIVSHNNMVINKIADKVIYFNKKNSKLSIFQSPQIYFDEIIMSENCNDAYFEINREKFIDLLVLNNI